MSQFGTKKYIVLIYNSACISNSMTQRTTLMVTHILMMTIQHFERRSKFSFFFQYCRV